MRTQGSLRVVLNTKVWPAMTIERASPKSIRISAMDPEEGVKICLIMVRPPLAMITTNKCIVYLHVQVDSPCHIVGLVKKKKGFGVCVCAGQPKRL